MKHENTWISTDKTVNTAGQCIFSTVLGPMKASSKLFLLNIKILEHVNCSTVPKFFNDLLAFLWPVGVKYDNVLLFLSDAASYVVKAAARLKILYPKLLTCLVYADIMLLKLLLPI